jgi:zinc protease
MTELNRKTAPDFKEIDSINFQLPEISTLDNSIPYVEYNMGSQELIKIDLVFRAGVKFQSKPLQASMTSKMLREGTTNFNSLEIANKIDFYGAFLETDLNSDFATVSLYALNKQLDYVLPMLKEVVTLSNFPQKEFDKKINIKKQQYIIGQEKVETLASKAYSHDVFKGTKYANKTTIESFDELSHEDCISFFNEYYNLNEMDVFVAGKVDSKVKTRLNELFGQKPLTHSIPEFEIGKSEFSPSFQFIEKKEAIQSSIRIGSPLISYEHKDFNRLKVMNTIFGGYFGSRLMANIREEKGYTYGIGSVVMAKENMGNLIIYTEVGTDVTQATLDEIRKEIKLMQTEKVGEEELYKVKNYLLGSLLQNTDGVFDQLERYKTLYYFNLPNNYYSKYIEEVRATTPEEIITLANTYLNDLSFVVAGSQSVS